MRYVAAFRAYEWDPGIAQLAERFFRNTPGARHVVLLDETYGPIDIGPYEKIGHTEATQHLGLPVHPPGKSLWFNCDYGIYILADALPDYDYYVLSESDLAVNLDLTPMLERVHAQGIDFVAHRIEPAGPDWIWQPRAARLYAESWKALLFFMVVSARAAAALFAGRVELGQRLKDDLAEKWPFCETFVPSLLKQHPGLRLAEVGDYAAVPDLNFRPRLSLNDPRANAAGTLAHSVLDGGRFIRTLLRDHPPRSYFTPGSVLWTALRHEPFEAVAGPLRAALEREGDRLGLAQLDARESPGPAARDLAVQRPSLSSSVCPWSHFPDPALDAAGANGAALAEDFGFHTDEEDNPWWMADLGAPAVVDELRIVNRRARQDRFTTFQVHSSSDAAAWLLRFEKTDTSPVSADPINPWVTVFPDPFVARWVRITQTGRSCMHLRQVRVLGRRIATGRLRT